ncbi:hypothetical protein BK816_01135 [Boudabousia tangfeifanii]|uniref:RNA polymerase sigma-70 region 4 domain-containing protein n=1 Tax=Boudabousia tangfeifanii TaxID=1912795 RepID=A0A1D9MIR1_9ACTO|nr:sigma-70 family RNA polymerase sigma factor [Boudabousia tangfeifanii]AOZ72070.1 hypothetical protein BK816_01135 [Boudabousia tangfeifanii]
MAHANNNNAPTTSYTYNFADSQVTINVSEQMREILIDLDRQEANNNQTERTRFDEKTKRSRHVSFEALDPEDKHLTTGVNPCEQALEELDPTDALINALHEVLDRLSDERRELLKALYDEQIKSKELAARRGKTPASVSKQHSKSLEEVQRLLAELGFTGWPTTQGTER